MKDCFSYHDDIVSMHYTFTKHPQKKDFFMHTHDKCELYLFLSGKGVFYVEGTSYELYPGDILIMRESEAHYIKINENTPYLRFAINFKGDMFDCVFPDKALVTPFYKRKSGENNLYRKEEFESNVYPLLINNILNAKNNPKNDVFANLIPLLNEIKKISESKNAEKPEHALSHQIAEYINNHMFENLTLEKIAKRFYISKSQLCKLFKETNGSTIQNYITVKRLIVSKNYLENGIIPTAVAGLCGYKDYSSYYRAFKGYFGKSPKHYCNKTKTTL